MGVASLFLRMFLRKLNNRSGSVSVQIISKDNRKYKVIKTIGSSNNEQEVQKLIFLGKQEMERLSAQGRLFVSENDIVVEQLFEALANASIKTVGPELILAKITALTLVQYINKFIFDRPIKNIKIQII